MYRLALHNPEDAYLRRHGESLRFPPRTSPLSFLSTLPVRTNAIFPLLLTRSTDANAEDLAQKERKPPPDPTPVNLPARSYTPSTPAQALKPSTWQTLVELLASVRQPQDVTPELLELLNIHLNPSTSFADLLPDPSPFNAFKAVDVITDRGNPYERMSQMVREMGYSNDQAIKSLLRLADGPEKVTLSYARRFWSGLEHMSQYWDTSLDEFYEVPDVEPQPSETIPGPTLRQSVRSDGRVTGYDFMSQSNYHQTKISLDDGEEEVEMEKEKEDMPPKMKRVYKGRRTGTGREMQEEFRDEMLKGFIESAAWAHGCQVVKPLVHPRLAIGTILVPMRQNFVVGRSPKERTAARRGVLEGPVLGLLGRGIMGYWIDAPWPELEGNKAEAYDLLREVGAMLELAQERARDGKEEQKPGAGKWWTSKRRWGGGAGGPMGYEDELQKEYYIDDGEVKCVKAKKRPLSEAEVDKILAEPMEEGPQEEKAPVPVQGRKKSGRDSKKGVAARPGGNLKRWNMMADRWKLIQPGSSLWDDQRVYMRIGKEQPQPGVSPAETFDNIFLVSSLNHHISVLRMRVSDRYLAWLQGGGGREESASSEESFQAQANSGMLQLWRTKWYDLFIPEERLEAQKGVWNVMGWLMKQEGQEGK